jgi:hypothetical protein
LLTILNAGQGDGILAGMNSPLRKITVQVPEDTLDLAQKLTGEGVTETVRFALQRLVSRHAQQELLKLGGKFKFSRTWQELKHDR